MTDPTTTNNEEKQEQGNEIEKEKENEKEHEKEHGKEHEHSISSWRKAHPIDPVKSAKLRRLVTIATIIGISICVVLGLYGWRLGIFTNTEKMQEFISRSGAWGVFFFFLLQIIQCIIPIIPGNVTSLFGIYFFGPLPGFLLNYLGICTGEVIIFLLARAFGPTFVHALMKPQTFDKYSKWLDANDEKIKKFFIWTMVLPGMPDDVICMIMGLTKMPFKTFFLHLLWTKVPALLVYTFFLDYAFKQGGELFRWLKATFMS